MARFLPAKHRFRAIWNEPQRMKFTQINQLEFVSPGSTPAEAGPSVSVKRDVAVKTGNQQNVQLS
jgi:hypothetical protein